MSIEELKLTFCKNEDLIKELETKKEILKLKIKELAKQITELDKYKQYINNSESEETRLKLINTEKYKEFLDIKKQLDKIKEKISEEETKLTKEEFEEILNQSQCNHVYYNKDEEKICIKCMHAVGTNGKNNLQSIKDLRKKFIYTEISSVEKGNMNVTEFLQNETLEHLIKLTKELLEIKPKINNENLVKSLEEKISEENIKYIEGMHRNEEDMPEDTKESYESYKKRTKR